MNTEFRSRALLGQSSFRVSLLLEVYAREMLTLCERVCPGQSDVHLVLPKTRKPVPEQAKETPELLRALVPVGAVPCALLLFTFATEEGGISGLVLPSGRAARSPPAPPPGDAGSGQAAG